MGDPTTTFKDKMSFFHTQQTIPTEATQEVYEALYKAGHTVRTNEVWAEAITYCATAGDCDTWVTANPTIGQKYTTQDLTEISGSNGQAWYINDSAFIKDWINPRDAPHATTGAPSYGFQAILYKSDGTTVITPSEGVWGIDYKTGIVWFESGSTPTDLSYGTPKITAYVYIGDMADTTLNEDKVKVDVTATADYIGAAYSDGVIRTDNSTIGVTDGGSFITLAVKTDGINDTHIDWGVGANQVSAVDVPIADAGTRFTGTEVETALQEIGAVFKDTSEPSGFLDRTATLGWDDGTYTFTITGAHTIYLRGVKTVKSTTSKQIADTTGLHWIYYDTDGVIQETTDTMEFNDGKVPIATVYWNTTTNKGLVGEERHGVQMDGDTHHLLHYTVGARYESGLAGTFDDTTFSIAEGIMHDEDIEIDISVQTTCNLFYKDGDANYKWLAAQTKYYYEDGSSDINYNDGNALAAAGANLYVAYWIFATNDATTPIVSLMGQRVDTNIANARANNKYESLTLGTLPFQEMKLLYRVIVRNDATPYEEAQDLRSVSNLPAGTYVATAHNTLTGLTTGDDHTQYVLADGTRALTGNWDAGSFKITAETLGSDVTTGTAPLTIASTTKVDNLHVARATLGDTVTVADTTSSASFVGLFESATGNLAAKTDAGITYNASTGTLAVTTITGDNVTTGANPGHTHTGTSLSDIDISDDTNLAVTTPIVLTDDTLSHSAANGYVHTPADGISTQILQYSSAGTSKWITLTADATIADGGVVTVVDDSHNHTGATLSGIDISADTNLAVTAPIVLTDDTISITVEKDIVAGTGLTGGADDVLPGADADVTISLSHLGMEDLTDPAADRIIFWDDSETKTDWLVPNTGLGITALNLNVTADYSVITANDGATDITAAEMEELTDGSETTLHSHAGGGADVKAAIDVTATADYVGAAFNDGFLRTDGTILTYADGGNHVTLGIQEAAADDSTKGVATFEADDFDDASGKIDLADSVAKSVVTDSGTATPSTHALTLTGGVGITTTASSATATVMVDTTEINDVTWGDGTGSGGLVTWDWHGGDTIAFRGGAIQITSTTNFNVLDGAISAMDDIVTSYGDVIATAGIITSGNSGGQVGFLRTYDGGTGAAAHTLDLTVGSLAANQTISFPATVAVAGDGLNVASFAAAKATLEYTRMGSREFGDGNLGDLTTSGNISMTEDRHYRDLTNNHIIDTNGFRLFVSGTLDNNGTIHCNGVVGTASGGAGVPGTPAGGAAVGRTAEVGGSGAGGAGGAYPGVGAGTGGVAGAAELTTPALYPGLLLTGAGGGGGASSGVGAPGANGTAGSVGLATAGGAGGANPAPGNPPDQGASGGAGGSGGGVCIVYAFILDNTGGTISADGGVGGAGVTEGGAGTQSGNGGGGGGGAVVVYYVTLTAAGTIQANGGAAGAGGNGGAAGSNGTTFQVDLS